MTKKQVWRYYCEFCKKSGCSGGHIARHERSCTANPNRKCRMHRHIRWAEHPGLPALIAILTSREDNNWQAAVDELRKAASGCPCCMLAAIRQSGIQKNLNDEDPFGPSFPFDFKTELHDFWEQLNDKEYVA